MGESHAIHVMICYISNAQIQMYKFTAATVRFLHIIDGISLKCFSEKDSSVVMPIMYGETLVARMNSKRPITNSCLRHPSLVTA